MRAGHKRHQRMHRRDRCAGFRRGASSRLSTLRWSGGKARPSLLAAARLAVRFRARADAAARISRSGTHSQSKVASSAAELAVTGCAPTLAARVRALRSERGESRATISVIVKPASRKAAARKVARRPLRRWIWWALGSQVFGSPAQNSRSRCRVSVSGVRCQEKTRSGIPDTGTEPLYWSNGEIGRNEIEGPRAFFPGQLSGTGV